jgi:tyrosyl-tRNA synthetase
MNKQYITVQDKLKLILSLAEEVSGKDELESLLSSGSQINCYDGFEPSGQMHIAQGILRAINTNKIIKSGFSFKMYVADWFAYLNNKMGGDISKIKDVGIYFKEIWKASGMDLEKVDFVWTSDFVKDDKYWELVMKIAKTTTLKRIIRTTQIMGRSESDELSAGMIFYPCMQVADMFYMKIDVAQLGMDQRKVNMLAREVAEELGYKKPIVVAHPMIRSLEAPIANNLNQIEQKMSKSRPDSAIFMTDDSEDVRRKILKAYCPEGEIKNNPILEYCKYIIFEANHLIGFENLLEDGFIIERPEKYGGTISFGTYQELEDCYKEKHLFPLDLKNSVTKYLNMLIQPVRDHFTNNIEANSLLNKVKSYQITR